jgi:hypothetical protein
MSDPQQQQEEEQQPVYTKPIDQNYVFNRLPLSPQQRREIFAYLHLSKAQQEDLLTKSTEEQSAILEKMAKELER